jgi:PilZ domain
MIIDDVSATPTTPARPAPQIDAPAVIVPIDGLEPVAGEVTMWSAGTLVITARVRVGTGAASVLNGHRVWVRATAGQGMVVVQAVAKPVAGRRDEIELTGVVALAVETRRTAVRARLERAIVLLRDGTPSRGTTTLDLSSSGCRLRLPDDEPLAPGERLQTVVTGQDGDPMLLLGEVVWVDTDAGEAALHFVEVSDADRFALEHDVLSWHAAQASG